MYLNLSIQYLVLSTLFINIQSLSTGSNSGTSTNSNNKNEISRIAVMTSGGDCPSLNACIRAIYKTAKTRGVEVIGLPTALPGLMKDDTDAFELDGTYASTSMLTKGGSRLGGFVAADYNGGFDKLTLDEKVDKITASMRKLKIDGIIATGGDSTFDRLAQLSHHAGGKIPFVGIPKTIDNDIPGTIFALGFNSAVCTAADAIANIRDTAESHRRVIVVECMGREAGFLTLHAGIAGGADTILLGEFPVDNDKLVQHVREVYDEHKCAVITVSESVALPQTGKSSMYFTADRRSRYGGSAEAIARFLSETLEVDARHLVLGHLQRGGSPSSFDKVLATNLGSHAVNALCSGMSEVFVTWNGTGVENVQLDDIRGAPSKSVTSDYSELITAQAMGIYCGETMTD